MSNYKDFNLKEIVIIHKFRLYIGSFAGFFSEGKLRNPILLFINTMFQT